MTDPNLQIRRGGPGPLGPSPGSATSIEMKGKLIRKITNWNKRRPQLNADDKHRIGNTWNLLNTWAFNLVMTISLMKKKTKTTINTNKQICTFPRFLIGSILPIRFCFRLRQSGLHQTDKRNVSDGVVSSSSLRSCPLPISPKKQRSKKK